MAFLGGDMSNHRVRLFSTAFKEDVVRRLESGEALAAVSKELGIARKLLYEWRWAWTQEGAEAEDRDRRSAGGRPGQLGAVRRGNLGFRRRAGQGEGAHRRA